MGLSPRSKALGDRLRLAEKLRIDMDSCQVPCDYILSRSYPLLQAREVLRLLAEGAERSAKTADGPVGKE